MKYSSIKFSALSLLSLQSVAYALPAKRDGPTTADVLNFALTLEHLESAFYRHLISTYSAQDFEKGGHPHWVRGRFEQVAQHEKTHVEFLTTSLKAAGAQPVQPCRYDFPCGSVDECLALANVFETLGTSAYTGAIGSVSEGAYAIAAGSILAVEARHSAWIDSAVLKSYPWSTAFETALTPDQVFTMASSIIKECPAGNPRLIAKPFPQLTIQGASPGKSAKLSFQSDKRGKPLFVAFLTGPKTLFVPLGNNMEVIIPGDLFGTVFAVVTNDGDKVTDETTVAGPAILMLPYNSSN